MALRWFLQATSMMIVGKSTDHDVEVEPAIQKKKLFKVRNFGCEGFKMPLHYPRYKKVDYERMDEWKLDMLLKEYGLEVEGSLDEKKSFVMGTFLWPDQF
ncbi:uncharacterized protein LOC110114967 [Dendrobium catenatum]|uniref:DUF7722 domain-containing protein n=1 Tax=Dendrobium catenatum TaxID=906689 RepID=A0A2I0XA60_9ASPA|nr:uncharacterized protein LOC110114967 [Dendrobium catenatum]PKU84776.1 hypothetical protein MA16_Dca008186 [Dendrobium catenatum]